LKKRVGRKPFGFYRDEAAIVEMIKIKRKPRKCSGGNKTSAYRIAIELNDQGFRTQKGKLYKTQTVCDILRRIEGVQAKPAKRYAKKQQLEAGDYRTSAQVRADRAKLTPHPELLAIYDILLGTGMRAGELCGLLVRDIDIEKRLVSIRHGKNTKCRTIGKRRVITASARAVELLANKCSGRGKLAPVMVSSKGKALKYAGLLYRVHKIAKIIGVAGFHAHVLRHTFATILYHCRKDLFFVAQQMGHVSVETTKIYAKCLDESKLQQMCEFDNTLFAKTAV
jgi:integrase